MYNSVLSDLREQTRWVALFHCKDSDSEDCLCENNGIHWKEERVVIWWLLAEDKHAKLRLKNHQVAAYMVI